VSDYVYLIGKSDSTALFEPDDSCDEIAYALTAVPVSWYALFDPGDIVETHESVEAAAKFGNSTPGSCTSLIKARADALALYAKRKPRLLRAFPEYVAPLFDSLEKSLAHSRSAYIQMVLSDLDEFISFPDSVNSLRERLEAMDTDDLAAWRKVLESAGVIEVGDAFGKVRFQDDERETVVGYVPDPFAITVTRPESSQFKQLKAAAEAGDAEAQYQVALEYNSGRGVKRNRHLAWEWMEKAANQRLPMAQGKLGTWYHDKSDYEKAVEWWRKAAEQDYAESQHNLGYAYRVGQGVPPDRMLGLEWTQKASALGLAISTYTLSEHYALGIGFAVDSARAVALCTQAAQEGCAAAQLRLAKRLEFGLDVAMDLEQAIYWYLKAAGSGNAEAQYILGCKYLKGSQVAQDYAKALELFEKAARQAHGGAQSNIGYMFEYGLGVKLSLETAFSYYCNAVGNKNKTAAFNLGLMYRDGRGVKKDIERAKREFRRALELGNEKAEAELKALEVNNDRINPQN
jgi:TPR repeat protein